MTLQRTGHRKTMDGASPSAGPSTLSRRASSSSAGVSTPVISRKSQDSFELGPVPAGVPKRTRRTLSASAQSIARRLWPDDSGSESAALTKLALKLCGHSPTDAALQQIVAALRPVPEQARINVCAHGAAAYVQGMSTDDTVKLIEILAPKTHLERHLFVERLGRAREAWKPLGSMCRKDALKDHATQGEKALSDYLERRDIIMQLATWALPMHGILQPLCDGPTLPNFFEMNAATTLVSALIEAFAPVADEMPHPHYAVLARLAPHIYDAFMALGNAIAAGHFTQAAMQADTLTVLFEAFATHRAHWAATLAPKSWSLGEEGLKLPESEFHRLLVEPTLRFNWAAHDWNDKVVTLASELTGRPRYWGTAMLIMAELRTWLTALSPDDAQFIDDVFDMDMLQRAELNDTLTPETIYRKLQLAAAIAKPKGLDAEVLASYSDFPEDKLAEAIVATCKAVWQRRSARENQRISKQLPEILERGIVWERENFETRLAQYNGYAPRTERWLTAVPLRLGETFNAWHARAITYYLLNMTGSNDANTPETLVLAEPLLRPIAHELNTLTRASVGELLFASILRARGLDVTSSERRRLQETLLSLPTQLDRNARARAVCDEVLVAALVALKARNKLTADVDLDGAHRATMLADLTDFKRTAPAIARERIAKTFAQQLITPNLRDNPREAVTPLSLAIEGAADDVRRSVEVDRQVHGVHYAHWLTRAL